MGFSTVSSVLFTNLAVIVPSNTRLRVVILTFLSFRCHNNVTGFSHWAFGCCTSKLLHHRLTLQCSMTPMTFLTSSPIRSSNVFLIFFPALSCAPYTALDYTQKDLSTGCQLNTCNLDSGAGSATFSRRPRCGCVTRQVNATTRRSCQP